MEKSMKKYNIIAVTVSPDKEPTHSKVAENLGKERAWKMFYKLSEGLVGIESIPLTSVTSYIITTV